MLTRYCLLLMLLYEKLVVQYVSPVPLFCWAEPPPPPPPLSLPSYYLR